MNLYPLQHKPIAKLLKAILTSRWSLIAIPSLVLGLMIGDYSEWLLVVFYTIVISLFVLFLIPSLRSLGYIFGIYISVFAIRVLSTAMHPIAGLRNAKHNWVRTMVLEDFKQNPVLLPGIGRSEYSVRDIKQAQTKHSLLPWSNLTPSIFEVIGSGIAFVVFWTAQVWRLSVKSTCWFYVPIFLLLRFGTQPDLENKKLNSGRPQAF